MKRRRLPWSRDFDKREPAGLPSRWYRTYGLSRKSGAERAADHQFDDLGIRQFIHRVGADRPAIAKDRERRAKRTHLAACDAEIRTTVVPERLSRSIMSPSHCTSRLDERRRRLVQQQDARIAADRAGDLYFLPRRQIEWRTSAQIDGGDAQRLQSCADHVIARPPPDHAECIERLFHQHEVLRDRQILHQGYFLKRRPDAERISMARNKASDLMAEDRQRASIRPHQAT